MRYGLKSPSLLALVGCWLLCGCSSDCDGYGKQKFEEELEVLLNVPGQGESQFVGEYRTLRPNSFGDKDRTSKNEMPTAR